MISERLGFSEITPNKAFSDTPLQSLSELLRGRSKRASFLSGTVAERQCRLNVELTSRDLCTIQRLRVDHFPCTSGRAFGLGVLRGPPYCLNKELQIPKAPPLHCNFAV